MRKYVLMFAVVGTVAGASQAAAQAVTPPATAAAPAFKLPAGATIAYVNSQRLIEESPGAREAQTTIQREMEKYRAELALLEDSIQNMVTDYEQKQVMMSPDAKKKQQDAIKAKQTAFTTRTQTYDQNMQKRQQDLVQPILDRINKQLEAIRKENNLSVIFDQRSGSIVQADTALDLTAEVLRRLKAGSPAAKTPTN